MSVYLIRHPETSWNIEKRFQGQKEGQITKKGKEEVKSVVVSFDNKKIDVIYFANNNRTRYVALMLKKQHPETMIIIRKELNERSMGKFEGKLESSVPTTNDFDASNYEARYDWKPPFGESHRQVSKRVNRLMKYIMKKYSQKNVVVVTSSGVIKNILHIQHNLTLKQMYQLEIKNSAVVKLQ